MNQCTSFAPVADHNSKLMILGSMPGVRSLTLQQYYGHPQNRFWPLLTAVLGAEKVPEKYEDKLHLLLNNNIALWDVLAFCERNGSLDSAITAEVSNDFPAFLQNHPSIKKICFNGGKAQQAFRKHHKALFNQSDIKYAALPSTSPANASWRFPMLFEAWQSALR